MEVFLGERAGHFCPWQLQWGNYSWWKHCKEVERLGDTNSEEAKVGMLLFNPLKASFGTPLINGSQPWFIPQTPVKCNNVFVAQWKVDDVPQQGQVAKMIRNETSSRWCWCSASGGTLRVPLWMLSRCMMFCVPNNQHGPFSHQGPHL